MAKRPLRRPHGSADQSMLPFVVPELGPLSRRTAGRIISEYEVFPSVGRRLGFPECRIVASGRSSPSETGPKTPAHHTSNLQDADSGCVETMSAVRAHSQSQPVLACANPSLRFASKDTGFDGRSNSQFLLPETIEIGSIHA